MTGDADVSGSTYVVGVSGNAVLAAGTTFTLVSAGGTVTADGLVNGTEAGTIMVGSTEIETIAVSHEAGTNTITAVVTGVEANEGSKALAESWIGGLTLVSHGADLVANEGVAAALEAVGAGKDFGAFVAMGGSSQRYATGSPVHINSFSMMAGAAVSHAFSVGQGTVGAFAEYGNGSYDTCNSFSGFQIHGDGDAHYYGLGLMGRFDFSGSEMGRPYVEASARVGRVSNEYENYGLRDSSGQDASLDPNTSYFSFHAGAGCVFRLTDSISLDVYGKYLWTKQGSDSEMLSMGEDIAFDASKSRRVRVGARAKYAAASAVKGYVGVAFEREFDGKSHATTNGVKISSPKSIGNTAIGEIGFTLTPSDRLPLTIDANISGYAGKRDGFTGAVNFNWVF